MSMNIPLNEHEQNLSNILCIKDQNGRVAIRVGLLATLFFDNQLTRSVRETVAAVADEYIELFRPHLRWAAMPKAKYAIPITSKRVRLPGEFLPQYPDGESWSFDFFGGATAKSASEFHFAAFGSSPHADGGLGYLHLSFPFLWFADRTDTFQEYVVKLCQQLRPISGYAGIGVLEIPDLHEAERFQTVVREIAERYPGLEIEDRLGHTIELRKGIKGINWLTILSDRWVKEMGDLEALQARLGEPFGFYPYEGGLVVQAGPRPQIGDVQANLWPKDYITLAKVLKKIQITDHCAFHYSGKGQRMNREGSLAWLFRFDGK